MTHNLARCSAVWLGLAIIAVAIPFDASAQRAKDPRQQPGQQPSVVQLETEGTTIGMYRLATPLIVGLEVIQTRQAGPRGDVQVLRMPGAALATDVEIETALGGNNAKVLTEWFDQVRRGQAQAARKRGVLSFVQPDGSVTCKIDFEDGWPSRITITPQGALQVTLTISPITAPGGIC